MKHSLRAVQDKYEEALSDSPPFSGVCLLAADWRLTPKKAPAKPASSHECPDACLAADIRFAFMHANQNWVNPFKNCDSRR